jgi:hypothetical protein
MQVAVMQPYLFPYIGYWQLIQAADIFVIYDDVNYIRRGWINRNYILERGSRKLFTLETRGAGQNKLINQISVGGNRKKLIKTLYQNYKKAPYFDSAIRIFSDLLLNDEINLAQFLYTTIQKICLYLMIDTKLIVASEVFNNANLRSADRLIDICKQLGADVYINAIGGKGLYNKDVFAEKGLHLFFIESKSIVYDQYENDPFVPNLSIIDEMMFNPVKKISEMLNQYKLID